MMKQLAIVLCVLCLLCRSLPVWAQGSSGIINSTTPNVAMTSILTGATMSAGTFLRIAAGSGYGAAFGEGDQTTPYSVGGYGYVEWVSPSTSSQYVVGFTNNGASPAASAIGDPGLGNTAANNTGPTYAVYFTGDGNWRFWDQEASRYFRPAVGATAVNDKFRLYYEDGTINLYQQPSGGSWSKIYTVDQNAISPVLPLRVQISVSTNAASVTNLKVLIPPTWCGGGDCHFSAIGTNLGDGQAANPVDIATAFGSTRPKPATGNWLADHNHSTFDLPNGVTLSQSGTLGTPLNYKSDSTNVYPYDLIFRAPSGHTMSPVNGASVITLSGSYVRLWNFEIYDANGQRVSTQSGSQPTDIHIANGITATGAHNKLINGLIHDTAEGIAPSSAGVDLEVTNVECINIGWQGTDRGHGPCFYGQQPANGSGANAKHFQMTPMINGYYVGAEMNQSSPSDSMGFHFDKIFTENNDFIFSNSGQFGDSYVNDSVFWQPVGSSALYVGTGETNNYDFSGRRNHINGQVTIRYFTTLTWTNNQHTAPGSVGRLMQLARRTATTPDFTGWTINTNDYYRSNLHNGLATTAQDFFILNDSTTVNTTFPGWKGAPYNLDTSGSTYTAGSDDTQAVRPTTNWSAAYANPYTIGACQVHALNWQGLSSLSQSLAACGLVNGQQFSVYSFENPKTLLASGTFNSGAPSFSFPTTSNGVMQRLGDAASTPATAMPTLLGYLVWPGAQTAGSAPAAPSGLAVAFSAQASGLMNKLLFTWTVNSNTGDSSADTNIIVDWTSTGNQDDRGNPVVTEVTLPAHTNQYLFTPPTPDLYSFSVRAHNGNGDSVQVGTVSLRADYFWCYASVCVR